jgi:hypothetical protein
MVDETTYNELDRYFTGSMQGEERAALEQRLSSDAGLKAELDWIVNATAAMKNSGRMVMKQHIAAAIAGVPAKDVQRYQPAKNAKPLWKKWWIWAVAVAIIAAALFALAAMQKGEGQHDHFDEPDASHHNEQEQPAAADYLMDSLAHQQVQPDSCLDEMKADSVISPAEDDPANEQVRVSQPAQTEKNFRVDSTQPYLANSQTRQEVQRNKPMNTRINLRRQPPYAYFLDDNLTLYANYSSTAGFTFRGSGDTIYMTDNNAQTFMLLRGKGEQPLVPLRISK